MQTTAASLPSLDPSPAVAGQERLYRDAVAVLDANRRDGHTLAGPGEPVVQSGWISCLAALGFSHFDEDRGYHELETLAAHQWPDGMIPHAIFHDELAAFPEPELWRTGRPVPTSGITFPPLFAAVLRRLYERAGGRHAIQRTAALVEAADRWHRWLAETRDPDRRGLVAIIHPLESARRHSIDWDAPLASVPRSRTRRPGNRADEDERGLWLIEHFRDGGWDLPRLHENSPFQVVDVGFNAVLMRAEADLCWLAEEVGQKAISEAAKARHTLVEEALDILHDPTLGQYVSYDRHGRRPIHSPSYGGLLPLFASYDVERLAARLKVLKEKGLCLVPSHDPADPRFAADERQRGPIQIAVNMLLVDGLASAGFFEDAEAIRRESLALVAAGGFAECFHPWSGDPLGPNGSTATAAATIELLRMTAE